MKILFLLSLLLFASSKGVEAKLNVIATTADLGSIAREVGGDLIKVTVLARPAEDPHFVDAKPSFLVAMSRADLLIEGGAELEAAWLGPLIDGSRNPKLKKGGSGHFAANQGVEILEIPAALDRSQGDIHAAGNPHYLTDPTNARIVAENLSEKFSTLAPADREKFELNRRKFVARLDVKMKEWEEKLRPYRGQQIVAYHKSWPYFARHFAFRMDFFLEPKPGIPPTPAHLASVIEEMKRGNVKAIFCEPFLNHKTAERVAEETGARVVEVSQFPGALKGVPDDYVSLLDQIVNALAQALGKS